MDFRDLQFAQEHRRDLMREAEQHRLAKEARDHDEKPGLSFPMTLLDSLIPHQPQAQPEPQKKPVRRPA